MKKLLRLSLIATTLLAGTSAQALTFDTVANTPFTSYFSVTPTETNWLAFSVSGLAAQYSSLSFELLPGTALAMKVDGKQALGSNFLTAAFSDFRNSNILLTSGTSYLLKVSGVTKGNIPGTFGIVTVSAAGLTGTITPVPEPETYAMLIAGLGLVGTIARRRRTSKAD